MTPFIYSSTLLIHCQCQFLNVGPAVMYNDREYFYGSRDLPYNQAAPVCTDYGATMVTIGSEEENTFIRTNV